MPSHTEGRPFSTNRLTSPSRKTGVRRGGAARPLPARLVLAAQPPAGSMTKCPLLRQFVDPRRSRLLPSLSHAVPCGVPRPAGVARRIRQSPRARSRQHHSQTRGPFLLRHYPVSAVLRPHPPPRRTGSAPHGATVGQRRSPAAQLGFPCCTRSLFRTCRRHYPGGTVGCACRSPSPTAAAFPVSQAGRLPHCPYSRPARRSLLVTARTLAESLTDPFTSEASVASLPPPPFRLLPAGTTLAGWDLHPLRPRTFARHTEKCGLAIRSVVACYRRAGAQRVRQYPRARRADFHGIQGTEPTG